MNIVKHGCGISEDLFVEGWELARTKLSSLRGRPWKGLYWLILCPVAFLLSGVASYKTRGVGAFTGFFAMTLFELLYLLSWPWRRRRNLRKYFRRTWSEHPTCITTLDDQGYTSTKPGGTSCRYEWASFVSFIENERLLLLLRREKGYVQIFKHAYTTQEIEEIKAEISRRQIREA